MYKDLSAEFIELAHRFRRVSLNNLFPEVTKMEFLVLKIAESNQEQDPDSKGVYVSHIAACLNVTPSAISRMLKGLEERSLIKRQVDINDRRNTYVSVTAEGEDLMRRVEAQLDQFSDDVISVMGEEDVRVLVTLFNKLVDTMEMESKKYTQRN